MKPGRFRYAILGIAVVLTSCAQPERIVAPSNASGSGAHFSGVGKVTLHQGQPCASQIMFDFRFTGARSTISLGAPMTETRLLTDAANRKQRVQIWGKWQRSPDRNCDYVSVTRVKPLSIAVMF